MSQATPIVFVVDDDFSVREALDSLIRQAGWQPELFVSAQDFLAHPRVLVPNCLVLDVTLPGLNGLELQSLIAGESPLEAMSTMKRKAKAGSCSIVRSAPRAMQ